MKYRMLGNTGLRVSEIGFGAWAIGGPVDLFGIPIGWGPTDDNESRSAIRRALELGVTFFDTADVYGRGHSEDLLGECLEGKDCVIATKVGNRRTETEAIKDFSTSHINSSIEGSLKRLRRGCIDLYQLHNPPPDVLQTEEPFRLLDSLKTKGKIRARGVSIARPEDGVALIREGKVDSLQVLFNVLNQEPARELIPLAEKEGVGIIPRVPLASGLLTGKFSADTRFPADDNRRNYLTARRMKEAVERVERMKQIIAGSEYTLAQISLAFLLRFSGVSAPIPGAKNPRQVEQNVGASDVLLNEDLFAALRREFHAYNFYLRNNIRV